MVDFSAILDKTAGLAEAPSPPPPGTYFGTIVGVPTTRTAKTKDGEKGLISFQFALTEAGEDVDAEELEKTGGLRMKSGEAKKMRFDFWLGDDNMWILDRFVEGFGFERDPETGFGGKSYKDMFEEIVGRDVTMTLESRSYEVGGQSRTTVDIKRVFATPS